MPRPRHLLAAVALGAALLVPATADASFTKCKSKDMRYPFEPGGPKYFGVFKLRIDGGGCKTARSVAKEWMQRFEADLERGKVRLPKNVQGFAFKKLAPDKSQSYNEKGVKGSKTIRFEYTVPNG